MRHILVLGHSRLLENYAVALCTVMLGTIFPFIFEMEISTVLLLMWNPHGLITVRERGYLRRYNIIDLGRCHFNIIFHFDCGKAVTPIFMGQGTIVPFSQSILDGLLVVTLFQNSLQIYAAYTCAWAFPNS